tara:strand:+ start:12560 stop:13447 length:888 start_codon:yes stop_codon:yes gene_type:complete
MSDKTSLIITGGTGFIGSYLLKKLLSDGYKVFAVSRKLDQNFIHPDLTWVSWENYKTDIPEDENIYAVLNLATTYGQNNEAEIDILNCNVELPLMLFRYAISIGAKKIINTDSFFGKPEYDYQHLKTYIKSKNLLVEKSKKLIKNKQISLINLRLEHVFGANDGEKKFVTSLLKDFYLEKESIPLTDGTQKRDFIYIDDVVRAFSIVISNHDEYGFTEHEVGSGKSIELRQFCIELANAFNVSSSILNFGALEHRDNEIMESSADISSLISIGWHPKWDLTSAILDLAKKQTPLN